MRLTVFALALAVVGVGVPLAVVESSPLHRPAPLLAVGLDVTGHRSTAERTLDGDISRATRIVGLGACEPNRTLASAMPAASGFLCLSSAAFSARTLGKLEHLEDVESITRLSADLTPHELYFLGVVPGEVAMITEPVGAPARALTDLRALRRLAGVIECSWSGPGLFPVGAGGTIACATATRLAAVHAQRLAGHLNVRYAEVTSI